MVREMYYNISRNILHSTSGGFNSILLNLTCEVNRAAANDIRVDTLPQGDEWHYTSRFHDVIKSMNRSRNIKELDIAYCIEQSKANNTP